MTAKPKDDKPRVTSPRVATVNKKKKEARVMGPDAICKNCNFLQVGQWFGPRCTNKASPFYDQHMSEQATCEKFAVKQRVRVPVVENDGLYDPEPSETVVELSEGKTLQQMLEEETEPNDVSGE